VATDYKSKPKFIRRNGRIIPIRNNGKTVIPHTKKTVDIQKSTVKKARKSTESKSKLLFQGAASAIGGAFLSAVGGSSLFEFGKEAGRRREGAAGLFKRGAGLKKQMEALKAGTTAIPKKDLSLLKSQAKTFTKAGAFHRARASAIGKQGFVVGAAALLGGTFLLQSAAGKFLDASGKKKDNDTTEAVFRTATAIPAVIAAFEYGKKAKIPRKAAASVISKILSKGRM
jgi:hypothetical protein